MDLGAARPVAEISRRILSPVTSGGRASANRAVLPASRVEGVVEEERSLLRVVPIRLLVGTTLRAHNLYMRPWHTHLRRADFVGLPRARIPMVCAVESLVYASGSSQGT
jgi:hypothetical protein